MSIQAWESLNKPHSGLRAPFSLNYRLLIQIDWLSWCPARSWCVMWLCKHMWLCHTYPLWRGSLTANVRISVTCFINEWADQTLSRKANLGTGQTFCIIPLCNGVWQRELESGGGGSKCVSLRMCFSPSLFFPFHFSVIVTSHVLSQSFLYALGIYMSGTGNSKVSLLKVERESDVASVLHL